MATSPLSTFSKLLQTSIQKAHYFQFISKSQDAPLGVVSERTFRTVTHRNESTMYLYTEHCHTRHWDIQAWTLISRSPNWTVLGLKVSRPQNRLALSHKHFLSQFIFMRSVAQACTNSSTYRHSQTSKCLQNCSTASSLLTGSFGTASGCSWFQTHFLIKTARY